MAVITTKAERFLEAAKPGADRKTPGTAVMKAALLVSPDGFRLSRESAADNAYMIPGLPLDLDQAHPTVARDRKTRVIAEVRDLDPRLEHREEDRTVGASLDLTPVDRNRDRFGHLGLVHRPETSIFMGQPFLAMCSSNSLRNFRV